MDTGTLKDLLNSGKTPEEINAILSGSTVSSGTLDPNFMAGEPYMPPQQMPMPQNYIRNERTGATYDMGQSQPSGPALDYSSPIEIGGRGKGYRLKGDASRVMLQDGRMFDLGRDTGAERARILEDMKIAKARQELEQGGVESQLKRAQLAELMGQDPSQVMGGGMPQGMSQGGPVSSQELAGQVNAARQKFLARRFGTPPTGHRWDEAGNAVVIPGFEKPLTEFQGKSSGFGVRAATAHEQLNALEGGALGGEFDSFPGYQNGPVQPGVIKRSAEALPLIGESMGTALNFTQSAAQQRVDQAQRNFVNATLRQESGAAISQGEWDNAKKQYFPQPGDDASVIEQKRKNREQVIGGFKTSAGRDGAAPIAPAQSSMRESLQQEMAARKEAIDVIKANPAARAEVIKRMQAMKYSTKGL